MQSQEGSTSFNGSTSVKVHISQHCTEATLQRSSTCPAFLLLPSPPVLPCRTTPTSQGLCLSHSCIRSFEHMVSGMEVLCLKLIQPSSCSSSTASLRPSFLSTHCWYHSRLLIYLCSFTHSICNSGSWFVASVVASLLTVNAPCSSDCVSINFASSKLVQNQDHSKYSQWIWMNR